MRLIHTRDKSEIEEFNTKFPRSNLHKIKFVSV